MPALDIAIELDAAVRAALDLNALWTAKVGVKFFAADATGQGKADTMTQANAWPRAFINVTVDEAQRPPMVFAMNSTSYASTLVDVPIPCSATVVLFLIHQNLKPSQEDRYPLESAVRSSLMAKWPKLGKSYVTNFSIGERRKEEVSERTKKERRAVTEFTLTLTLRPMLSQLTG